MSKPQAKNNASADGLIAAAGSDVAQALKEISAGSLKSEKYIFDDSYVDNIKDRLTDSYKKTERHTIINTIIMCVLFLQLRGIPISAKIPVIDINSGPGLFEILLLVSAFLGVLWCRAFVSASIYEKILDEMIGSKVTKKYKLILLTQFHINFLISYALPENHEGIGKFFLTVFMLLVVIFMFSFPLLFLFVQGEGLMTINEKSSLPPIMISIITILCILFDALCITLFSVGTFVTLRKKKVDA